MKVTDLREYYDDEYDDTPYTPKYFVLKAGTVLFHGTNSEWDEANDVPDSPLWVSDSKAVAHHFRAWKQDDGIPRVIQYGLVRDIKLILIETHEDLSRLAYHVGEEGGLDVMELAQGVCSSFPVDGWIIPHNYQDGGADIMLCDTNVLNYVQTFRETTHSNPFVTVLSEVHYTDLYPTEFEEFHKKYRKIARKESIHNLYVQFTNYGDNTLDRTSFEKPDHTDPRGVYAYPLKYVLSHPADIWYGASAQYLRVIRNTAKRPLYLKEIQSWSDMERLLFRMGLDVSPKHIRWVKRKYRHTGRKAPLMTFMSAFQKDHDAQPEARGWEQEVYPMRSAQEQADLLLKAGYDAVIDEGTGAINEREPEQAIFLTRASFRVEEVFQLHTGDENKRAPLTVQHPEHNEVVMRKFANMIARSIDDKLIGKVETSNLGGWHYYWTKRGRRIEIAMERPPSYYDRGIGEKPHKYDKKHTNHKIEVQVRTEFGDIDEVTYPYEGDRRFRHIADNIGLAYRKLEEKPEVTEWTPEDRASFRIKQKQEQRLGIANRMRREEGLEPLNTYEELEALQQQGLNVYGVPFEQARNEAREQELKLVNIGLKLDRSRLMTIEEYIKFEAFNKARADQNKIPLSLRSYVQHHLGWKLPQRRPGDIPFSIALDEYNVYIYDDLIRNVLPFMQEYHPDTDNHRASSWINRFFQYVRGAVDANQTPVQFPQYLVQQGFIPMQGKAVNEAILNERKIAGAGFLHRPTGKIYGPDATHYDVSLEIAAEFNLDAEDENELYDAIYNNDDWVSGFVTDDGQFLDREQAAKVVKFVPDRTDVEDRDWLDSYDLDRGWDEIRETLTYGPSKTLYHGTTVDAAREIMKQGMVPGVGAFVSRAYGDYESDYGIELQPLVFATDKERIERAVNAMTAQVAHKLSKTYHKVTEHDLLVHGALIVLTDGERFFAHSDEDNAGYEDHPEQVEPGDYYSDVVQDPSYVLYGKKMRSYLMRHKVWPVMHAHIHKQQVGEDAPTRKETTKKFWYHPRTGQSLKQQTPSDMHVEILRRVQDQHGLFGDEVHQLHYVDAYAFVQKQGWVRCTYRDFPMFKSLHLEGMQPLGLRRAIAALYSDFSNAKEIYVDVNNLHGDTVLAIQLNTQDEVEDYVKRGKQPANVYVNRGVSTLGEAKYRQPIVMYHGTSSARLRSILKQGVIPNPQDKVWADDPNVSAHQASRVSLSGSYWASNLMTAISSSRRAVREPDAHPIIVIAQISEGSSLADEDSLISLEWAWASIMKSEFGVVPEAARFPAMIWYDQPEKRKDLVRKFAVAMHDALAGEEKQPVPYELAARVFEAYMLRLLAHARSSLHNPLADIENPPVLPSVPEAEQNFLAVKDALSRYYRQFAKIAELPSEPTTLNKRRNTRAFHTLRTEHPVTFRGSNKIIGVVSLPKNDYNKPLVLQYGRVTDDFQEQYRQRVGSFPGVVNQEGKYVVLPDEQKRVANENHDEHAQALAQTGFWGRAGAGCIIMARSTGRILLPLRSAYVEQPGTWGTWGGAIDQGENPADAVRREVQEEAGVHSQHLDIIPLYVFESGDFRYYNFLAVVDEEFEPQLNWETERAEWFEFGDWPTPLHFGIQSLLKDADSRQKIKIAIKSITEGKYEKIKALADHPATPEHERKAAQSFLRRFGRKPETKAQLAYKVGETPRRGKIIDLKA